VAVLALLAGATPAFAAAPVIQTVEFRRTNGLPLLGNTTGPLDTILVQVTASDDDGFRDVTEIGVTLYYDTWQNLTDAPALEASFVWRRSQGTFLRLYPDSSSWAVLPALCIVDSSTGSNSPRLTSFAIIVGKVARASTNAYWSARAWVDGASEPGSTVATINWLQVRREMEVSASKSGLVFQAAPAGNMGNPLVYPPGELAISVVTNDEIDLLASSTDLEGQEDSTQSIPSGAGGGVHFNFDGLVSGDLRQAMTPLQTAIPPAVAEAGETHRLALTVDYAPGLSTQDYIGTLTLRAMPTVGGLHEDLEFPMTAEVSSPTDSAAIRVVAEVFPHSALNKTLAPFTLWLRPSFDARSTGLNRVRALLPAGYGTPKVDRVLEDSKPVVFIDESTPEELSIAIPGEVNGLVSIEFRVDTPIALDPAGSDWKILYDDLATLYAEQVATPGDANGLPDGDNLHVSIVDQDHRPQVSATIQSGGAEAQLLVIQVTAVDPDGDPIDALKTNYASLPSGNNASFSVSADHSSGIFTWTPGFSASPGPYPVYFAAYNALGDSTMLMLTITNTDRRPVVIAPTSVQGAEGSPLPAPVVASDPDGDPILSLVADLDSLPPGNSATFIAAPDGRSGQVQWTPGFTDAGSYVVRYYASNALTGTGATTLDISNTDRPPTTNAPPTVSATPLVTLTIDITGSDPDGEAITSMSADLSSLQGSPSFTPLSPGVYRFQWTPGLLVSGSFDVTFRAHNALTGVTYTRIDVGLLDRAPLVTVARNVSVVAGDTLALAVSALDPDGDPILSLQVDLADFPLGNGAYFTTNPSHTSGVLTWVPRATDAPGDYDAVFTASNALSDSALSTVRVTPAQRGIEITGVAAASSGVRLPGGATGEVLAFSLVNRSTTSHSLRSLRFEDRTTGPGTLDQRDAEWGPLTLMIRRVHNGTSTGSPWLLRSGEIFDGGEALFDSLFVPLDVGDSLAISLQGGASLLARDGDVLDVEVLGLADLGISGSPEITGTFPINPPGGFVVDGMTRSQISLIEVPATSFQVGSRRNTALAMRIPANGYETDVLRRLNVRQHGSALPDSDLIAMEAWVDDGNSVHGPGDARLGSLRFTGDRWELTGLSTTIPLGGLPVIVTVDIADVGTSGRTIRLGLPGPSDFGVGVASGNGGPIDGDLDNTASQVITVRDRVTIAGIPIESQVVHPGEGGIPLLTLVATNTYDFPRRMTGLVLTNVTSGPGTIDALDGEFQSLALRADGNDNGLLDGPAVDPVLAAGVFVGGRASFAGFAWNLPAGSSRKVFVVADLSLTGAADGDRIEAQLERALDVSFDSVTTVAALWPVRPGASHPVDGLLASQVVDRGAPGVTLGPGDGPVRVLDVVVPRNGYADDVLQGFRVVNAGTAGTTDIAELRLWRDGGDDVFDAGAGDDRDLGPLSYFGGSWQSALLAEALPAAGAHLYVGMTVAAAPGDSVLVLLEIPTGGIAAQSGNSGPLDQPVRNPEPQLISTAPLLVSIQIAPPASTPGIPVTVRMNVHNSSLEQITGIAPSALTPSGAGGFGPLSGPNPATADLDPGQDTAFVWTALSATPGDVRFSGLAAGTGSGLPRRSLVTTSNAHQVFSRTDSLNLFAIESMPLTVNRGQDDVLPLTLTLSNDGPAGSSDVRLLGLRIRLEDVSGSGLVPASVLDRVEVREGASIYAVKTALETSGSEVDVTFTAPVTVRTLDPVTLGLRVGISPTTTVPEFRITVPDGGHFTAEDATSGFPVRVASDDPGFPVLTGLANVISSATELQVTALSAGPQSAARGQAGVKYLDLTLFSPSPDSSASDVRVGAFDVKLLDSTGVTVPDPGVYVSSLEVRGPFGLLASMGVPAGSDSVLTLDLSPLVSVPVNTPVGLTLSGTVAPAAPLGVHRLGLGPAPDFIVRDAGTGELVPANYQGNPLAGDSIRIELAASEMRVAGTPQAPPVVGLGRPDVPLFEVAIRHPGTPETGRIRFGPTAVHVLDEVRRALDAGSYVDRLSVYWNGTLVALPAIPASGPFVIDLDSLTIAAGDTATLALSFDVETSAPVGFVQFEIDDADLIATDENTGAPIVVLPEPGATLPMTSGLFRVQPPARTLSVAFQSLMPPAVAAGAPVAVAGVVLTNVAVSGTGTVVVDHFTLRASDRSGTPLLAGAMCERVELWQGATRWGDSGVIDPAADTIRVSGTATLDIAAQSPAALELRLTPRGGPLPQGFRLGWQASGIGVVQPSSPLLQVAVLPEAGESFPMWTAPGNLTPTTLEASYSNFPNPFAAGREATAFVYYLPSPGRVTLRIFTARGDPVATVLDGVPAAGGLHQSLTWDGRNGRGTVVTNGVYVAELKVAFDGGGEERLLRKLAVVR